jgi:hypothetical protein
MEPRKVTPPVEGSAMSAVLRAVQDQDFRERLRANPKAALEETLRISIADEVKIHVHQGPRTDVHLVLPDLADIDAELAPPRGVGGDLENALKATSFVAGKALRLLPAIPAGMYDWG